MFVNALCVYTHAFLIHINQNRVEFIPSITPPLIHWYSNTFLEFKRKQNGLAPSGLGDAYNLRVACESVQCEGMSSVEREMVGSHHQNQAS